MRIDRIGVALSVQAVLSQASWVGLRLMIGYRGLDEGAGTLALGILAASFAAPALVTSLPLGRLADRHGGALVTFYGGLVALAGVLGVLMLPGLDLLVLSSVLVGLGHLAVMIGQQTFAAARSLGTSPDTAFGNLTAAASLGQLIGPPAVAAAAAVGLNGSAVTDPDTTSGIVVAALFTLAALPMFAVLRTTQRPLPKRPRTPVRSSELVRTPGLWRSLVVSGAVLVTVDLMYAFIPAWATERGIDVRAVGLLLALRAGVSVISRVGLARLVARFGRRNLILVSVVAAAGGLCSLPFVGAWGAVAAMIGLGLGLGIPQPLTMSWVIRLVDPALHGAALGLRMSTNRLAQITLPLAVGAVATPIGVSAVFFANAALLAGAMFALPRAADLANDEDNVLDRA